MIQHEYRLDCNWSRPACWSIISETSFPPRPAPVG